MGVFARGKNTTVTRGWQLRLGSGSGWKDKVQSRRARRNELTANMTNARATPTEAAINPREASRVHARNARLHQANAKTANMAPATS